jgi:hypothetical protein
VTEVLDTVLLEKSGLSADDLHQARLTAGQKGIGLGRALLQRKAAAEEAVLEAAAEYFRLPLHTTLPQGTDIGFTARVPIGFLKKNLLVVVRLEGEPCIAVNDPFEFQALDELRSVL